MSPTAALPPVRGRHRNRALAAARRARAVELRTQGWTYQAIADELGYAGRAPVWRLVQSALQSRTAEAVDGLRQQEFTRLEALLAAYWDAATTGDLGAARTVLDVIRGETRLLGLAQPRQEPNDAPRKVVVPPRP
ncbi:hypothetical protein [Terrabacter sp. 2RAF25]|uniref:hypothetical protein n=1 Tax=Terrabacter sp. 2RAF25 TaxID=3232998 RepID=UPI003F960413